MEESVSELAAKEWVAFLQRDAPLQGFVQHVTWPGQALSKCAGGWCSL